MTGKRKKRSSRPPPPSGQRSEKGAGRSERGEKGEGKKKKEAGRKLPSWLGTAVGVVLAFTLAALFVALPSLKGAGTGKVVVYTVPQNATYSDIAADLARQGVIANEQAFRTYVTLRRPGKPTAGVHLFSDKLSIGEVVKRLSERGSGERVRVTIPEGWNRYDIAKRLETNMVCTKDEFLRATREPKLMEELRIARPSAEGFLFPATYSLPQDSLAEDVVRRMAQEFEIRWAGLQDRHAAGALELGKTLKFAKEEIVTLASIVEKEAAVDDERAVIAGVFLNRLREPEFETKGKLQSDPTSGYGCLEKPDRPACAEYKGKITGEMNRDPENEYSTYTHEGLPPGPIANPGARSIAAVLAPAQHRFFYFVAKGGGRHTFSETFATHNSAVEERKHP